MSVDVSARRTDLPRARGRTRASHATGFWIVTVAFTVLMAFGTVPTPLWPLYEERDGFGATTVTVAFAAMVVGAAISFLFLGHLSDFVGRRRIIAPALLTSATAALCLLLWPALPGLLLGRVLTGVAVGLMASTATTYLSDLHHAAHPERRGSAMPGLVATAANLGGLALGSLLAGVLAEVAPAPLTTPYVLFAAALVVLTVLVLASPETVDREPDVAAPARFALRPGGRRAFAGAAAVASSSFAAMGLFSSLGAMMIHEVLDIRSHVIAGVAPFVLFAASAVAQVALGRLARTRMLITGVTLFPVGLLLTVVALSHPVLWLYLVAAAVAGAGAGLLFKGAVGQGMAAARHESRAGVLAVLFVVAYVGMGAPSIAFSVVSARIGLLPAMTGFAVLLSVATVIAVAVSVTGKPGRS